jgi:hypothetical protein
VNSSYFCLKNLFIKGIEWKGNKTQGQDVAKKKKKKFPPQMQVLLNGPAWGEETHVSLGLGDQRVCVLDLKNMQVISEMNKEEKCLREWVDPLQELQPEKEDWGRKRERLSCGAIGEAYG